MQRIDGSNGDDGIPESLWNCWSSERSIITNAGKPTSSHLTWEALLAVWLTVVVIVGMRDSANTVGEIELEGHVPIQGSQRSPFICQPLRFVVEWFSELCSALRTIHWSLSFCWSLTLPAKPIWPELQVPAGSSRPYGFKMSQRYPLPELLRSEDLWHF